MLEYTRVVRTIPVEEINRMAVEDWELYISCSNFLYFRRTARVPVSQSEPDQTTAAALERGRAGGLFTPGGLYALLWYAEDNWFIGWNDAQAGMLEVEASGATISAAIDSAISLRLRRREP